MHSPKPPALLNRDREWTRLAEAHHSPQPELLLCVGRRRAGKSFLLVRFVEASTGLYYQATRKTEREQLLDLSRALGTRFDDPALRRAALPDWDAVLDYVVERAAGGPFTFVLDEFPYLADATPALSSIIQAWWDHRLAGARVTLVLSGSHVTAMKRLTASDQPLYGRRTGRVDVLPFDYYDAARFVPSWPARDKLRLYAIFGGLPGHLALIEPTQTLAANAARHLFDASGRLYDEAAHAFDSFLGDAAVHYSIVEAIASGTRRWSRIASRVGKQTSALSRPLEWLLGMDVVERVAPLTAYPRPSPKRTLYRLADPYLTFWHRFVSDVKGRGLTALVEPEALWDQFVAPRLDREHVAYVFEEACRQFVARAPHPSLPFRPVQVGSWWNADSSEEVDVVALDGQGGLLVGECKWGMIDTHDLERLVRRGKQVAEEAGGITKITPVLFSASGLRGDVEEHLEAHHALHVPIETLYAPKEGAD